MSFHSCRNAAAEFNTLSNSFLWKSWIAWKLVNVNCCVLAKVNSFSEWARDWSSSFDARTRTTKAFEDRRKLYLDSRQMWNIFGEDKHDYVKQNGIRRCWTRSSCFQQSSCSTVEERNTPNPDDNTFPSAFKPYVAEKERFLCVVCLVEETFELVLSEGYVVSSFWLFSVFRLRACSAFSQILHHEQTWRLR